MEKGQLWRQYIIASIANCAVASSGYAMAWTAPINVKLDDPEQSPLPEVPTPAQIAWIGSLLSVGAIFGPFVGGFAAARIGRKWGLLCVSIPLFIGWILVAVATDIAFIYAGRIFWGFAIGMISTLAPMYSAEIATDDCRGALGSFVQIFICSGYQIVYSVGPFVSYSGVAYVGVAVVAVFCVGFFFMPESPIYHLTKNNREAATDCLAIIRGRTHLGVQEELDQMDAGVKATAGNKARVADVFRGSNLKAFYISFGLLFFQQFSGVNAVMFYLTEIFLAAGVNIDAAIATIIVGAVQVVAALVTSSVVNRLGRRVLLMASSCGSAIGLFLLGVYFLLSNQKHPIAETINWLPLFSLVLFVVAFCWGLGALPWAILGEFFSIEIKAVAAPIATSFTWIVTFLVTRYFGPVADAVGMHVSFFIFGVSCTVCFFFTLFCVPETKGKSFSEIQDILAGRKSEKETKTEI